MVEIFQSALMSVLALERIVKHDEVVEERRKKDKYYEENRDEYYKEMKRKMNRALGGY